MNTLRKKDNIALRPGTIISGKWHRNRYKVIRLLGSGTVGSVYLCSTKRQMVALKISKQSLNMTAEVQVLKALREKKVQDCRLGPYLIDVDDWVTNSGEIFSFYAMEYIKGVSLRMFIRRYGSAWIGVFLLQLLEQLEHLHSLGYVFGDLKNENIIVTSNPPTIRLIDVGGTTKIGRSVKEYTNFYDRAYWRLGKRLAEPSYDLFAIVMVFLTVFYPRKFTRTKENLSLIKRKIANVNSLQPYQTIFSKALSGDYRNAKDMRDDLFKRIINVKRKGRKNSFRTSVMEVLLITGCASLYFCLYYVLVQ